KDFHEDDYLYINNGDGTFTESLYEHIGHTSSASMGNDIADINNDGLVDIVSLDMMPGDHETFMRSGSADLMQIYEAKKQAGYGDKSTRNTLQLNRGQNPDGTVRFSETAFTSGVARTDWSWAALLADFDNSGYKDFYVTNGMVHRPNDLDYQRIVGNIRDRSSEGAVTSEEFETIEQMPTNHLPNVMFQNMGGLQFENQTEEWGVNQPSYGSGAVYADLNNNGMLDLVVNNINEPVSIYQNNAEADSLSGYLKVKLKGSEHNRTGIGAKVMLFSDDRQWFLEQMPTRGFQSSVPHELHFGLGSTIRGDSLRVIWPDGKYQTVADIELNQTLTLDYSEASGSFDYSSIWQTYESALFEDVSDSYAPDYMHEENNYNDFAQEPLIPYKLSEEGPALAAGDISGNGLDDLFVGSSHDRTSAIYLQTSPGVFEIAMEELLENSAGSEDVDALFFDATGNDAKDLYVVSGGGQLLEEDEGLKDRLYINNGEGDFTSSDERLPEFYENGSVVRAADFNGDGATDLFVAGRSVPWRYGVSPEHRILQNDGEGYFTDVTDDIAPDLREAGMITDAAWGDITGNGRDDLVVAGEWMPVLLFENRENEFVNVSEEYGLGDTHGLWQSILIDDINSDGTADILAGNFGTNSRIQATSEHPYTMYINDYDDSGYTSGIVTYTDGGKNVPFEQLDELLQELPFLTNRVQNYRDFSTKSIEELLGDSLVNSADLRKLREMESMSFIQNEQGSFDAEPLPAKVQMYPVRAIHKIQESGQYLLGGNEYSLKPSYGGRQDAGFGTHLVYETETGFTTLSLQESGFYIDGQVKNIKSIQLGEIERIISNSTNSPLRFFGRRSDSE
ncbi:MAG: VCBS repeat-containing protein, partial [Balneolaceae bacterium]